MTRVILDTIKCDECGATRLYTVKRAPGWTVEFEAEKGGARRDLCPTCSSPAALKEALE